MKKISFEEYHDIIKSLIEEGISNVSLVGHTFYEFPLSQTHRKTMKENYFKHYYNLEDFPRSISRVFSIYTEDLVDYRILQKEKENAIQEALDL